MSDSSSSNSAGSSAVASASAAATAAPLAVPKIQNARLKQVVSSSGGAFAVALIMTPLDVVKVRLQAQNRVTHKVDCLVYRNGGSGGLVNHICSCLSSPDAWYNRKIPGGRYYGTVDAMVKIVRSEGISSLWSGLPPTLFMTFPQVVLYFSTYEETKRLIGYHEITNPNPVLPILSGGLARIIAVTAVSPIELVRTKVQSERLKYWQIADAVRSAVKTQGLRSLYRGWVSTVWRDVPFSMIYWFNYEKFKTFILKVQHKQSLDNVTTFICGAMAGSIAACITCPLDVCKTYRQIQLGELDAMAMSGGRHRTVDIIREIYRTKGFRALFAGLTPRVSKVALSCAIMITTFEYFKKIF